MNGTRWQKILYEVIRLLYSTINWIVILEIVRGLYKSVHNRLPRPTKFGYILYIYIFFIKLRIVVEQVK